MKIKCTKEEHAELVARCHEKGRCGGCVLENICDMLQNPDKKCYQRLTELVEIEGNPLDVICTGLTNGYPCDSMMENTEEKESDENA